MNINDASGSFCGVLFGVSNTIATIPGIVSPYLVGVITPQVTKNLFNN